MDEVFKKKTFYIMFQGEKLGEMQANNRYEVKNKIEQIITIEEVDEDE